MALRLWKRKKPKREDKQLKQRMKISERALDDATLETLYFFLNHHDIDTVDYPIAQGKEAIVYRGTIYKRNKTTNERLRGPSVDRDGNADSQPIVDSYVAVKVFKYETTSFKDKNPYLEGDDRFVVKKGIRPFVNEWTRKEYANLVLAYEAGCSVPEVYRHRKNVILMEFMGEQGVPYAKLQEVVVAEPEKMLDAILTDMRRLYTKAQLVHADINAYNVLVTKDEKPFLIDFAQGVKTHHPKAEEFLVRDVHEILEHFRHQRGIDKDEKAVLAWVKGEDVAPDVKVEPAAKRAFGVKREAKAKK